MTRWREFVVLATLMVLPGVLASAQDTEQPPPPPVHDSQPEMEIPASTPHLSSYGTAIPPGWNVSMAADALGVYDSNPAFLVQAEGDEAQRYSGNLALTYVSKHTFYQADYMPSLSRYRQFTSLNSTDQNLSQSLWQDVSTRTGLGWRLSIRQYPSWGGSAFSSSSFGSLLMQLSGLTGLNLLSRVSSVNTGFAMEHRLNRRSRFNLDLSGGVSKYVHMDSNQLISLLTAPDSSTWSGQVNASYTYHLSAHRMLGVGVASSYLLFTSQNYHIAAESAAVSYSENLRDNWSYSISVGPEIRAQQRSSGGVQPGLSLNLSASHKTRKSDFRASVVNSYQTGQAQGNLTSWNALLSFEHAIRRRWFAGVFTNYQRSESLVASGPLGTGMTQSFAPAVDGGARLSRHVVWFANYGFSLQKGALTTQQNLYRQQFVTGLSFNVDSLFPR